jgi:hypothetical protein
VKQLRALLDAEQAYYRKALHYASLDDLVKAGALVLTTPHSATVVEAEGYRYELRIEKGGFSIVANPVEPLGRSFIGDDTGIIQANP